MTNLLEGLCLNPDFVPEHEALAREVREAVQLKEPFPTREERAAYRRGVYKNLRSRYLSRRDACLNVGKPLYEGLTCETCLKGGS